MKKNLLAVTVLLYLKSFSQTTTTITGPGPGPTPVASSSCTTSNPWYEGGNSTPADNRLGTCSPTDLIFRTNSTDQVWVTAGGNVGIGTGSPAFKFDVSGDAHISNNAYIDNWLKVLNPAASGGRIFAGHNLSTTGVGLINSYDVAGNVGLWLETNYPGANSYGAVIATKHNDAKSISVIDLNSPTGPPFGYKQVFTVLGNGRTGIGISNPMAMLEVSESAGNLMQIYGNQWGDVVSSGSFRPHFKPGSDFSIFEGVPGFSTLRFTIKNGKTGIGIATPQAQLDVAAPNGTLGFHVNATQGVTFGYVSIIETDNSLTKAMVIKNSTSAANPSGLDNFNVFTNGCTSITLTDPATSAVNPFSISNTNLPASSQTLLQVSYNGNVGVGTSSPLARLDISDGTDHMRIYGNQWGDIASSGSFRPHFTTGKDFSIYEGVPGNSIQRFTIVNGNVGINTSAPSTQLTVNSGSNDGVKVITGNDYGMALSVHNTNSNKDNYITFGDGTTYIGDEWPSPGGIFATNYPRFTSEVTSPTGYNPRAAFFASVKKQTINENIGQKGYCAMFASDNKNTRVLSVICTDPTLGSLAPNQYFEPFRVYGDGRTIIGYQQVPGHTSAFLSVSGEIVCKALYVFKPVSWQDRVFSSDYKLQELTEVEKYIKENNHLPGIKPEKEILENGYDVNEVDAALLEKIENLYLYVIKQQKEIDELKSKLKQQ